MSALARGVGAAPAATARPRSWQPSALPRWGLVPAGLLLGGFFLLPIGWVFYASLTDASLVTFGGTSEFVGLENYRAFWDDANFWTVIRNSVVFVAGSALIGQTGLGLGLALLIHHARLRGYRLAGIAYGAVLAAWICPVVITGVMWARMFEFYDGTLNRALAAAGVGPVDWLGRFPMLCLIGVDVWRGAAFAMVIFLGAMQTVPADVYEAASVDGAGAWARFRDQTLPVIRSLLLLVLLMTTMAALGSFVLILTLTNGGPAFMETTTLALYAYRSGIERFEIGYGSAIAVVMVVVSVAFAALYLRALRDRS